VTRRGRDADRDVSDVPDGGADGPDIRALADTADYAACVALQKEIWGQTFSELIPPSMLRVAQEVGGVSAGAFTGDGELAGFIFGISGIRDGRLAHWSDTLAIRRRHQGRGLGRRLKRYQRRVLLEAGIETVFWTFDPLESKNAYLNLSLLGARARGYHADYYGQTESTLHAGLGTDRLLCVWEIASERVSEHLRATSRPPPAPESAEAPLVTPTPRGAGSTQPPEVDTTLEDDTLRIAIPADIQSLKLADPELAAGWRRTTRLAFEEYLARGYVAEALVRDGDRSYYVISRRGGAERDGKQQRTGAHEDRTRAPRDS
jgi:predicted GNAT superfamily acetyltransferase